LGPCHAERIL